MECLRSTRTSCISVVTCIPASLNALWMLEKVPRARKSSTCSRRNAPRASISRGVTRRRPTRSPEPDLTGVPHIAVPPPPGGISLASGLQKRACSRITAWSLSIFATADPTGRRFSSSAARAENSWLYSTTGGYAPKTLMSKPSVAQPSGHFVERILVTPSWLKRLTCPERSAERTLQAPTCSTASGSDRTNAVQNENTNPAPFAVRVRNSRQRGSHLQRKTAFRPNHPFKTPGPASQRSA